MPARAAPREQRPAPPARGARPARAAAIPAQRGRTPSKGAGRLPRRPSMLQFTRTLALSGLICATGAVAAPRAESALECGIAADMAVVAHSLAKEQVQRTKADTIMARIYDVSQSDRGKVLMKDILDAAYVTSGPATKATGQEFAEDLFSACMKT